MERKNDPPDICSKCGCKTYGLFPCEMLNSNNQKVIVRFYHCLTCGWTPRIKMNKYPEESEKRDYYPY